MDLLFSNYPPVRTKCKTFAEAFYGLIPEATRLDIAVGYISQDSIVELQKIIELNNNIRAVNLVIGMHYYSKFTRLQYDAAMDLNSFLRDSDMGSVSLVKAFQYHGKLYSYSDGDEAFAGIIGSSNLGAIVDGWPRQYESSLVIREQPVVGQMRSFIGDLASRASCPIDEVEIQSFNEDNLVLDNPEYASKVSTERLAEIINKKTSTTFDIPIKTSKHSSLNVYFGKGRESKNGVVKPRHWYEIELIVPSSITRQKGYPIAKSENAEFTVITDDGWTFKCQVSGDYSKNFRSKRDLKILGKWLKGRLELAGALSTGGKVCRETLNRYGRDTFTLTKTTEPNVWFLDFGVK